jgi:hypothetical protein
MNSILLLRRQCYMDASTRTTFDDMVRSALEARIAECAHLISKIGEVPDTSRVASTGNASETTKADFQRNVSLLKTACRNAKIQVPSLTLDDVCNAFTH